MRERRISLFLVAVLAIYVAQATMIGRLSGFDEPWYKSAGREWGLHGRFASPELTGFMPNLDPPPERVYFPYTPLYSFLFGVLVRVAGFGWRQCVGYDAAIHATLAGLTYVLARRLGGDRLPRLGALAAALAVLAMGEVEGRPDELAMSFAMLGLIVAVGGPIGWARAAASGALFGLCAGTSVGAAVMLGYIAFAVLVTAPSPWPRRVASCLVWGLSAGVVLGLVVAPILIPHPRAIDQFSTVARMHVSVGNLVTRFFSYYRSLRPIVRGLAPVLLIGLWLSTGTVRTGGAGRWLRLWLGPILGIGFMLATVPQKLTYLWFLGPWMIVATASELALAWPALPSWKRVVVAAVLAGAFVLGSEKAARNTLILATLPPSQRADHNEKLLAALIPAGRSVLTLDSWWLLARDHVVYDARWALVPPSAVDFVVVTGNGSGVPGQPVFLDFPLEKEYHLIADNLNRSRPTFLGRSLTNSSNGFGALVYERNQPATMTPKEARP